MTLVDHLYELRYRLGWAAFGLVLGGILGFIWFSNSLFGLPTLGDLLIGPYCQLPETVRFSPGGGCRLLQTEAFEVFMLRLKVGIAVGAVLTSPLWLYQLWYHLPGWRNSANVDLIAIYMTGAATLLLLVIPFIGKLSDKVGRKPTLAAFAGGFVVLSWPLLQLLKNDFWSVFAVQLTGMLLVLGYSANCAVIMAEQFPPEVRATGIALPYALSVALFGGTAPYITTWLDDIGHSDLLWLYVSGAALISLIIYLTMPETKDQEFA